MLVADRAYILTSGRGLLPSEALLEVLACVELQVGDFTVLTRAVLQHAHLISAAVCVLLDWDEKRRELIASLRALNVPVKVLVLGDKSKGGSEGGPHMHISEYGPMADCPHQLHQIDCTNATDDPAKIEAELKKILS